MVADAVSELIESLSLDATGRVYASLALALSRRLDETPRANMSHELREVVALLTPDRGATDRLLAEILADD